MRVPGRVDVMEEFKKALNDWMPKGVEASPTLQTEFEDNPELGSAIRESTTLLINEYVQSVALGDPLHGRAFSATLTKPVGDMSEFYLLFLISNGDAKTPKSRMLLITPEEAKDNASLWSLLGEQSRKTINAMIQRNAKVPN